MDDTRTRTCSFTAIQFHRDDMEHMAAALEAIGIDIDICFSKAGGKAEVTIEVPELLFDAELKRTRRAGRRRARINPPKDSPFTRDSTCEDFLSWLDDGHTAEEAMAALGFESTSTYFRRLRVIREKAKSAKERNPRLKAQGLPQVHPTLGGTDYRF